MVTGGALQEELRAGLIHVHHEVEVLHLDFASAAATTERHGTRLAFASSGTGTTNAGWNLAEKPIGSSQPGTALLESPEQREAKTQRVMALCERLADALDGQGSTASGESRTANRESLKKAAELCKTDLTTELVKEFTELQGIVGGLYARVQGEPEPVWQAKAIAAEGYTLLEFPLRPGDGLREWLADDGRAELFALLR